MYGSVCYGVCFQVSMWLPCWGWHHGSLPKYMIGRHIWLLVIVHGPYQECRVAAPPTAVSGGKLHATHSTVFQPFHQYSGAYTFGGMHLVGRALHCWITFLHNFHGQGLNTNTLPIWTSVWGILLFWPSSLKTSSMILILSSWILSSHQKWMHPLMMLMLCLLQPLQGLYACLVPFMQSPDCNLLLASNLIHYGAMLGHYFYLYHWQVKCKTLSWFVTFQVIQ